MNDRARRIDPDRLPARLGDAHERWSATRLGCQCHEEGGMVRLGDERPEKHDFVEVCVLAEGEVVGADGEELPPAWERREL